MIRKQEQLLERIKAIHATMRDTILSACEQLSQEQLAAAVGDEAGDTIFAIDRISEEVLVERFAELAEEWPCILIAEGLEHDGRLVLPRGYPPEKAELRIIVDPIDGTRGIMYQKRPAWILTGVAANRGPGSSLTDIELAVQTEIPLLKQHLSDSVWAIAGAGAAGERFNRLSGTRQPLTLQSSTARTIAEGYGGLAQYFAGARAELAALDDAVVEAILGPVQRGKAPAFTDQYISTGGQLYELMLGHDRWFADLRPLVEPALARRGRSLGLCCHPYDICTELIAREAGVIVTDERGRRLDAPLDVFSNIAWVGYANSSIYEQVAPVLQALLAERDLLSKE